MKKTLYILTQTIEKHGDFSTYIHKIPDSESQKSSFVFIQDGSVQEDRIGPHMYTLQDKNKNSAEPFQSESISYRELLELIFLSERVLVM